MTKEEMEQKIKDLEIEVVLLSQQLNVYRLHEYRQQQLLYRDTHVHGERLYTQQEHDALLDRHISIARKLGDPFK